MIRATIRDVARQAGVSIATVSRVLNRNLRTNPVLRERVEQAVRQLGYRPNPVVAALAASRFRASATRKGTPVAYVIQPADQPRQVQRKQHFPHFQSYASRLGYDVSLYELEGQENPARFARMLYQRGVAGVALDRLFGDLGFFAQIDWSPFCVVNLERRLVAPAFDTVRSAIFENMRLAWDEAVRRGYRRIGFALFRHHPEHPDDQARLAVAEWCAARGPSVPIYVAEEIAFIAPKSFHRWVRKERPDVILGFNAVMVHWLAEIGWSTPGDTGFISLSLHEASRGETSGVEERFELVARAAVDRLDLQIRRGWTGVPEAPVHILLPGHWSEGKTLRGR